MSLFPARTYSNRVLSSIVDSVPTIFHRESDEKVAAGKSGAPQAHIDITGADIASDGANNLLMDPLMG